MTDSQLNICLFNAVQLHTTPGMARKANIHKLLRVHFIIIPDSSKPPVPYPFFPPGHRPAEGLAELTHLNVCVLRTIMTYGSRSASTKSIEPRITRKSASSQPRLMIGRAWIWGKLGVLIRTR